MDSIIKGLFSSTELGQSAVFLALFLLMFYYLRKDSKSHKSEYQQVVKQMFDVVNKNTESNTRLSESIHNLKDQVRK